MHSHFQCFCQYFNYFLIIFNVLDYFSVMSFSYSSLSFFDAHLYLHSYIIYWICFSYWDSPRSPVLILFKNLERGRSSSDIYKPYLPSRTFFVVLIISKRWLKKNWLAEPRIEHWISRSPWERTIHYTAAIPLEIIIFLKPFSIL